MLPRGGHQTPHSDMKYGRTYRAVARTLSPLVSKMTKCTPPGITGRRRRSLIVNVRAADRYRENGSVVAVYEENVSSSEKYGNFRLNHNKYP